MQFGGVCFVAGIVLFLILEFSKFDEQLRSGRILKALITGGINVASGIAIYNFWSAMPCIKFKEDDDYRALSSFI